MESEERILKILGAWQEAQDGGEATDPEEVIAAHPDLAVELRARFDVVHMLEQLAREAESHEVARPSQLGEYRLVREVGRGGMGVVYEAEQTSLHRIVALKVLYPSITSSRTSVKRFLREARATGKLHHTNIVSVHSLAEEQGTWFYAMDLVRGRSLDEVIVHARTKAGHNAPTRAPGLTTGIRGGAEAAAEGDAPRREPPAVDSTSSDRRYFANVARMFAEVAEALQTAHDAGVIHRDIKPSNLMLDHAGALHITDFGVARLVGDGAGMTVTGELLGTPVYMSPEQARARSADLDHRTDVYSLGATLYEALTLRPPFQSSNVAEVYKDVLTREPASPRTVVTTVPVDLETIVVKAMQKEADDRYATAGDMAADLWAYSLGRPIGARRIGPVRRAFRTARRNKKMVAAVAVVLALGMIASVFGVRAAREEERRRDLQYTALLHDYGMFLEYEQGNDRIRAALDEAVEIRPNRPEAYYLKSNLYHGGTPEEGLADVARAAARGLDAKTALLAKWRLLTLGGDADGAAKARAEAARLPTRTPEAFRLEGLTLLQDGKLAEAETCFTLAIERAHPDSWVLPVATRERADVRLRRGNEGGALADYMAASLGSLPVPEIDVPRAVLLRRLGREQEAERVIAALLSSARERSASGIWMRVLGHVHESDQQDWLDEATRAAVEAQARGR